MHGQIKTAYIRKFTIIYVIQVSKGFPGSAAWQIAQKNCTRSIVRNIPMSLLRRKSCSALASTILESPLHRTKATCTIFFCAICQAALPGRPFDTRIHMVKSNYRTAAEGEYVAVATRRRRRILPAGFFFMCSPVRKKYAAMQRTGRVASRGR